MTNNNSPTGSFSPSAARRPKRGYRRSRATRALTLAGVALVSVGVLACTAPELCAWPVSCDLAG